MIFCSLKKVKRVREKSVRLFLIQFLFYLYVKMASLAAFREIR